ncbi:putative glyoxal oxidase, galactose oxidase/kelch, beta-propeller, immunoglobulin-like protein [Helianthus anomalus]
MASVALTPPIALPTLSNWRVRIYKSCGTCDWKEIPNGLNQQRWYATNHLLPDGRQIIIGGRQAFNYEFYPKMTASENSPSFPFLVQTNDPNVENNLYPFVFLYPDENLFVFANNRAILFNYFKNQVIKTYSTMPGGKPRNYPSTGSAVLLPLRLKKGTVESLEVLVCGGAPKGAFANANNGRFDGALDTCGRIKISDPNPQWVMETMPLARVMGDMLLLPNGHVLIINGASAGVVGWELVGKSSTKPRVYHSTTVLLRDGRVLVGGSNPHDKYVFTNVLYPTELSLEAFSPSYLDSSSSSLRPTILSPKSKTKIRYGKRVDVTFMVSGRVDLKSVSVTLVSPSFNTHSFSMNQKLLVLDSGNSTKALGKSIYKVSVTAPPSGNFAPSGNYILYVVHKEIPSTCIWVRIQR